jgi:lactam utilization protein B
VPLGFVKPHGILYNQARREEEVAEGVVLAFGRIGVSVLVLDQV